jgi:lambda family phage minor tail protein L
VTDPLARSVQSLAPGDLVTLFRLDLGPIGVAETWCFTPTPGVGGSVTFGGTTYQAADVEAEGFEVTGQGSIPNPTLRVSNATLMLAGIVLAHDDVVGARVTRIRTFAQYLDGAVQADPSAMLPTEVWYVEQKTKANKSVIEWKLAAATDVEGTELPKRVVCRDYCPWAYRRWKTGTAAFDYSDVECPFTGSAMFTALGAATTDPAADVCGRKISDCKLRFGDDGILPFGGFPGVGLNRITG